MVSNIHLRLWCDAQLAVFSNSFMWLTAVLPYLAVAERYFAGEIEFGVISQVSVFASYVYTSTYSRRKLPPYLFVVWSVTTRNVCHMVTSGTT